MVHKKLPVSKPLTLSLVIPAYNEEHHLKACLEAVARQTDAPDQVLVVDNNSTDKTVAVAKHYPFVTLVRESKQGVIFARDTGFNKARSDLIGRIDSDTILPPGWVKAVKAIMADPHWAAATGPVAYHDMPLPHTNYWLDHQIRQRLYKSAPRTPFIFGSNMVLRRQVWLSLRDKICHERSIHEDLDLAIHLSKSGHDICYDKAMLASTSARRYDDDLKHFHRYMEMFLRTYTHHGIKSMAPRVAVTAYWAGYILLNPVRRSYDPVTGKHTMAQLRRGHNPRKNPMSA